MQPSKSKKNLHSLCILFIFFIFYICFFQMERVEIGDVNIVRVIGIDKVQNGYQLTALYNDVGEANTDTTMNSVDAKGKTIYEAFENLKRKNKRDITIAHTSFFLIDDEAARSGLNACLDFLARDQTVKTNANIYILKSESTNAFIKKSVKDKLFIHETLASIAQKKSDELTKVDNTLASILNRLYVDYNNLILPYLVFDDNYLFMDGYAVFKQDKLYDYVDYELSQVIDLVSGRLVSCPIHLSNDIGLEIINMDVSKEISFVDDKAKLSLKIDFKSDIKEIPMDMEVFSNSSLSRLNQMQQTYVEQLLNKVIDYTKKEHIDLLGIYEMIATGHETEWKKIQNDLDSYYDNISYEINIKSNIANNYVITK